MKKKRIVSLSLIVALIAIIAGGTYAYFTDTTKTEENIFTVGNVNINLTEPNWNQENNHILPSVNLPKDPTITVEKGSDPAYVFMDMELNKYASFLKLVGLNEGWDENDVWTNWREAITDSSYQNILNKWFKGIDHDKWDIMNKEELLAELIKMADQSNANWLTIELGYKDIQNAGEAVTLFEAVTIPETVTSEMIEASKFNTKEMTWNMNFTGKAIQAQGFENYTEAYTALYK